MHTKLVLLITSKGAIEGDPSIAVYTTDFLTQSDFRQFTNDELAFRRWMPGKARLLVLMYEDKVEIVNQGVMSFSIGGVDIKNGKHKLLVFGRSYELKIGEMKFVATPILPVTKLRVK